MNLLAILDLYAQRKLHGRTKWHGLDIIGAYDTITRCRPVVCFEFEQHPSEANGDDFSAYQRFFGRVGYRLTEVGGNKDDWRDYVAEYVG